MQSWGNCLEYTMLMPKNLINKENYAVIKNGWLIIIDLLFIMDD